MTFWRAVILSAVALCFPGCDRSTKTGPVAGAPAEDGTHRSESAELLPKTANETPEANARPVLAELPDTASSTAASTEAEEPLAEQTAPADASVEGPLDKEEPNAESESEEMIAEVPEGPQPETPVVEYSVYDVLLPTTVAPLHVRLQIAVAGEPLEAVFERELTQLRSRLDRDGNGTIDWEELTAEEEVYALLASGQAAQQMPTARDIRRRYDLDRNGRVSNDELLRILSYGDAQYGACDLVAEGQYRYVNRYESVVLRVLDDDGNGQLTADELERSADNLRRHDRNADDIVSLDELRPENRMNSSRTARSRSAFGEAALFLNEASDWSLIGESLEWLPGVSDGPLGNFADGIDADQDGWFTAAEAQQLVHRKPHLAIKINLIADPDDSWRSELTVDSQLDESRPDVSVVQHDHAIDVVCPGLVCEIALPPPRLVPSDDATHPLRRGQVQVTAGEVPDVVFTRLDRDGDGALSGRERDDAAKVLTRLDRDGDGVVDVDEISDRYKMRVQWRAATAPPLDQTSEKGEDSPRWAEALDTNRDGEISRQEFPGTDEQFSQLDLDGNGYIRIEEARTASVP